MYRLGNGQALSIMCRDWQEANEKTDVRKDAKALLMSAYCMQCLQHGRTKLIMCERRCTNTKTEEATIVPTGQTVKVESNGYTETTSKDHFHATNKTMTSKYGGNEHFL